MEGIELFAIVIAERRLSAAAHVFFTVRHQYDFFKLFLEIVQEERIDDFMDIRDGCIVHPATATRLGIQGGLKDGPEDGRTNDAPVEAARHVLCDDAVNLLGDRRYVEHFIMEEPAIHVGEAGELFIEKTGALLHRRVQHAEELLQGILCILPFPAFHVLQKGIAPPKEPGVLCIEAEYDTDAEHIQLMEVPL